MCVWCASVFIFSSSRERDESRETRGLLAGTVMSARVGAGPRSRARVSMPNKRVVQGVCDG